MTFKRCFTPWLEEPAGPLRIVHAVIRCRGATLLVFEARRTGQENSHEAITYIVDSNQFSGNIGMRGEPLRLPRILWPAGGGGGAGTGGRGPAVRPPLSTCGRRCRPPYTKARWQPTRFTSSTCSHSARGR